MAYFSDTASVDLNSIELVCIYIQDHLVFSDSLLQLNANYFCTLENNKIVITTTRYRKKVDDFTNIHLICGMNGTGKSTILKLIKRPNDATGTILILKSGNTFISNAQTSFIYNNQRIDCDKSVYYDFSFFSLANSPNDLDEGNLNFYRGFLLFYTKNKELFSDIDNTLITHFSIEEWKTWENPSLACDAIRRRFGVNVEDYDVDKLKDIDMLSFLFYWTMGDSTFDDWPYKQKERLEEIFKDKNSNTIEQLILARKILINGEQEKKLNRLIKKIDKLLENRKKQKNKKTKIAKPNSLFGIVEAFDKAREEKNNSYYKLDEFIDTFKHFLILSNEVDCILSEVYAPHNLHLSPGLIEKLYYFRPVKLYENKSKRHLEDLSHGEFVSVKLRHDLFKRMLQRDCAIILDDEPDRSLHAEWSRTFVLSYINSVKKIREFLATFEQEEQFKSKTINILITTHSPIILSDFYNEEVTFLENTNGKTSQVNGLENCFAGNIAEILLDNFFIKRTIGAYSEEIITNIVKILNSNNKFEITNNKEYIESVIAKIGDSLLKSILEDQARRVFSETDRN